MNQGKPFERRVKKKLEDELRQDRLPFDRSHAKVFARKGYYSPDREGLIITDVSIEVYRIGPEETPDPCLVWIWECKDYSHNVPVDDIEEFDSKLRQLAQHRVRGTVVTSSMFQRGAVNVARARGIGLARLRQDDSLIRIRESERSIPISKEVEIGLCEVNELNLGSKFYGLSTTGKAVMSLSELIRTEIAEAISGEI